MANGHGEKFCLRWNEFEKNISSSLRGLRDDKDFFDVTLVCENNQIQAHKVILSACSPFFRSVLKQNPHQHPLLYLKGVQYEDIISVLNFMYHGEVNVAQEELNTFLAVAEDLKVKGLTQNNTNENQPELEAPPPEKKSLPHIYKSAGHRPLKQPRIQSGSGVIGGSQYPDEMQREEQNPLLPQIKTEATATVDIESEEDTHQMVVNNEFQEDNSGYEFQQAYEEQVQYETVDLGHQHKTVSSGWSTTPKPYPCLYCSKSFANQNSLQKHTKSHTGQTYCDICDKNFSNVPNLRAHTSTVHHTNTAHRN